MDDEGIKKSLVDHAEREGRVTALAEAQKLQVALGTLAEIGTTEQQRLVGLLQGEVQAAIMELLDKGPTLDSIVCGRCGRCICSAGCVMGNAFIEISCAGCGGLSVISTSKLMQLPSGSVYSTEIVAE